ncbi:MAG: class I SAM-dependent methyltransferase [Actinomycetota bacterium]|jgi:ubiquinone/menaquinone biosynthesis C-methylase UbiE|nr:class I SAM-dependent methyltransferase [Solirubrobacterales bacterium]MBA3861450.1 class I SAM-dependent methyltransferase [Solirubrobacterales bacterium]MDQ3372079.1 class I SAM-dependent methyltransferase [Actinomycetota bacterium]MDQ3408586.1 class I SAM-dependent methyltransferase [Actinomycetota bacterium]
MSLYGRLFAALYDRALAATEDAGLRERRARLLARARGTVVEIGAGTGLNLAHYGDAVERLILTEPEEAMARRLDRAAAAAGGRGDARGVEVLRAPAEALPLPDASADTVVTTLVLCTVDDPGAALAEIIRVLRPGGRLLAIEHVRSPDPAQARFQDLVRPVWQRVGHGCRCNRDSAALLAASPLRLEHLERFQVPKAAKFVRPGLEAVAIR